MKTKILASIIAAVMVLTMLGIPGMSALAAVLPTGDNFDEAPQNLTVELKQWVDGRPYFALKWTNPESIWELGRYSAEHGEWGAEYQIDMKIGNGQWRSERGESLFGNVVPFDEELDDPGNYVTDDIECDPMDLGVDGAVDIKANVYHLRVRYAYLISNDEEEYWVYSPFSNAASIGVEAFYRDASTWAVPELQKANDLGLIPNILMGADMTKPITREEFAELAVLLYEKATGKTVTPHSPNPFNDTANPQILKAYALGITTGTSATTFTPNKTISRQECATMLFRAIKVAAPGADYSIAGVPDFPDQKDIDSWAEEGTKYMFKLGIIKGDSRGYFMPKAVPGQGEAYGTATREAAILMTLRTFEKLPDLMATSPITSSLDLNSLISKALSIDTGYFEAISEVAGQTTMTKYWKKGSMVKIVVPESGDNKTRTDICDMSKAVAYSYYEGSSEAYKTVYEVSDPSKYINPFNLFNLTGYFTLGPSVESADLRIIGNETIDGVNCSVITITIDGEVYAKIWVSEDGLKRKSETDHYFGFPMTTVYKNYKIGGPISDSEFELPPGMTVDEDFITTITE